MKLCQPGFSSYTEVIYTLPVLITMAICTAGAVPSIPTSDHGLLTKKGHFVQELTDLPDNNSLSYPINPHKVPLQRGFGSWEVMKSATKIGSNPPRPDFCNVRPARSSPYLARGELPRMSYRC